jgi:hypothetical protein
MKTLLWTDAGERQTPLEAAAQALCAFGDALAESVAALEETGAPLTIDAAAQADLPPSFHALCGAAGSMGARLQNELTQFNEVWLAAKARGHGKGGAVTRFAEVVLELNGAGAAMLAIGRAFHACMMAEALARDHATAALSVGAAVTSHAEPDIVACSVPPDGSANA